MMLSPVLFAVSGMFMGILNARHHFLAPAFAPMFYNAAIIVGALISQRREGAGGLRRAGRDAAPRRCSCPRCGSSACAGSRSGTGATRRCARSARLMGPRVIGLAAFHLNFVVATFFASTVGSGAISAVNYAWLIVMTPLGLFGMAISTAVFPRMAEQADARRGPAAGHRLAVAAADPLSHDPRQRRPGDPRPADHGVSAAERLVRRHVDAISSSRRWSSTRSRSSPTRASRSSAAATTR